MFQPCFVLANYFQNEPPSRCDNLRKYLKEKSSFQACEDKNNDSKHDIFAGQRIFDTRRTSHQRSVSKIPRAYARESHKNTLGKRRTKSKGRHPLLQASWLELEVKADIDVLCGLVQTYDVREENSYFVLKVFLFFQTPLLLMFPSFPPTLVLLATLKTKKTTPTCLNL